MGDGLPRCLTADDFFEKVQEYTERQAQEEVAKERRREQRGQYAAALDGWKKLEAERKKREASRTSEFAKEMVEWKEEQALAKAEKRRPRWMKPKRGPRQAAIPKPARPRDLPNNIEEELEEIDINIDDCLDDDDDESSF